MEESLVIRVVGLFAILLIGIVGVTLPFILSKYTPNGVYDWRIHAAALFGAGVLASASLVHLFQDAVEGFQDAGEDGYPYTGLMVLFSALLMLAIETAATMALYGTASAADAERDIKPHACMDLEHSQHNVEQADVPRSSSENLLDTSQSIPIPREENSRDSEDAKAEIGTSSSTGKKEKKGLLSLLILSFALYIHSVILGFSFGAQTDDSATVGLLIAIVAHKGFAGFALGVSALEAFGEGRGLKAKLLSLCVFVFATPVGIAAGIGYEESVTDTNTRSYQLTTSVLTAISSGMLLYIVFMEMLPKTFNVDFISRHSTLQNLVFLTMLVLGAALMSMLAIWT